MKNSPLCHPLIWATLLSCLRPIQAQDSFLSDTLVRKGQVKNVLEHQPVKYTSCQNAVVWHLMFGVFDDLHLAT